jgi:hypothetical protein
MPPPVFVGQPDLEKHLGFLLSEEEALKRWLTGIKIPGLNSNGDVTVDVWYRYPEGERQIKYPFITIDMLQIEPDYAIFTSTYLQDPTNLYVPSVSKTLPPLDWGAGPLGYQIREYLPIRITWQVAHYARSALHDGYLTSIFMTDMIPVRPFFIYNDADGVDRRVDRIAFQAADTIETSESGTKRIFRKIYTISMLTEIPQNVFSDPDGYLAYQALRVLIPVVAREQFDSYFATILDGHADPIGEFTEDERQQEGEYFHITHEGKTVPSA